MTPNKHFKSYKEGLDLEFLWEYCMDMDLQVLRKFCEREGEEIVYRKGDQLEREGDPARWFGFVTEGCFKYP